MLSRSLWSRAAVIVGLVGLALTQPLLDLMGQNPEFFIAGRYTSSQIIGFGLVVALVPAAVLVAVVLAVTRLHARTGDVLYQLVVALLGVVFGNVLAHGMDLDGDGAAMVFGAGGLVLALVLLRVRPGRMLLEMLAVANVFFLVAFLVLSPTSRLLAESATAVGSVSMPTPPGPVVVIVFDELPLSTLVTTEGRVNAARFPAFARLAETSTWYRNASSNHNRTERAVPELLTGTIPKIDALPSYLDLPENLLTMFAAKVPVHRYEAITDMCPPALCAPQPPESLGQALDDAATVYGHRVLPESMRADLPAIDQAWGDFGAPTEGAASGDDAARAEFSTGRLARWAELSDQERSPANQAERLVEQMQRVDGEPALHFAHVVLPHAPWLISPWGPALMADPPPRVDDPSDPSYEWSNRLYYQRHVLQVGAADAALGEVLDHLESLPSWEDTTVVVIADHGTSTLAPDFGRDETPNNRQELYRVPLFIKAPGQTRGAIDDDPMQAIDLLPTLADVLDADVDWDFDGHSMLDGSEATVEPLVGDDLDPLFDVVRRHDEQVPSDGDWVSLVAVGEHAELVGERLSGLTIGPPSELAWQPDFEDEFDSLPTADGRAPQVLRGSVQSPDRPPELVVSVNGTIAGTLGGYVDAGGGTWRFASALGPFLRDGANEILAFEVVGDELRPLA